MKNKSLKRRLITTLGIIAVMNTVVVKADTIWDLTGSYVIKSSDSHGYLTFNDLTIDSMNLLTGNFSGTGHSVPGGNWSDPLFTWDISGTVAGESITAQIWNTGNLSGYSVVWYNTNINSDGSFYGEAKDSRNVTATFETISGHAIQVVPIPPSIWLFGTTLLGFLGLKRRQQ